MTQSTIPTLGAPAPDFTLPSTAGRDVTLSALRGRNVLLAFFPLAFTSTCTAELCEFSTDYGQFERADTVVLPISVDSVPTLKAFKAQERMTVDLLSDFRRDVSRAYGVLLEDKFFANRAYILIDREGRVRWTHVESQLGHKRATAELVAAVAAVS